LAKASINKAEPVKGEQARSGRHAAGELDQAAIVCLKQRNVNPDSQRARSSSHEAGEMERGRCRKRCDMVARGRVAAV
jgi:hypothetical protein